jgi:hypothetical protein
LVAAACHFLSHKGVFITIQLLANLKLDKFIYGLIVVCAVAATAYCTWALDRGFDITDESYYLLLAKYADSQTLYISAQHWVTNWIWQAGGGSIVMFRAAGLLILTLSSTLLAFGTLTVCTPTGILEDNIRSKSLVTAGSIICALLYASTINLSPCYNLLASAGAYAATGLVLYASQQLKSIASNILYFLAGSAIGVEVLCKASSGISTLIILSILLSIFERSNVRKISGLLTLFLGVITFIIFALLSNTTISDAKHAIIEGMQLFRMVQVESIGHRLVRYVSQFGSNTIASMLDFAAPIMLFILFWLTRRPFLLKLGGAALVITLLFDDHFFGGWDNGRSLEAPSAIFILLIISIIFSRPLWNKNRKLIVLFSYLLVLPYSVAMGTGNTIFTQAIVSLSSWGTFVSILIIARYPKPYSKRPIMLIGLCFIVVVTFQVVTSGYRPYHISMPLVKQDMKFSIGSLGGVKVDPETFKFLADLEAAVKLCEIAPGSPFLGLYNIPGVALALQVAPVLTPWLNNSVQADFVLSRVHKDELKSVVVALNMSGTKNFPPYVRKVGT